MDRVGEDTVVDPGYFVSNGTSLAAPFATAVAANVIAVSGTCVHLSSVTLCCYCKLKTYPNVTDPQL